MTTPKAKNRRKIKRGMKWTVYRLHKERPDIFVCVLHGFPPLPKELQTKDKKHQILTRVTVFHLS